VDARAGLDDMEKRKFLTQPGLELQPGGRPALFFIIFFYYLVCEAVGTAATPGLLCQPRVKAKMIVEK
jgi:hypothetical protein